MVANPYREVIVSDENDLIWLIGFGYSTSHYIYMAKANSWLQRYNVIRSDKQAGSNAQLTTLPRLFDSELTKDEGLAPSE